MKEKMRQFMIGRYGVDDFSRFQLWVVVALMVLNIFARSLFLDLLGTAVVCYYFFRTFSKNVQARYQENLVYLRYQEKVVRFFKGQKNIMEQRKTYHIYTCPGCRQKIRIPKGKGKIMITCPKCKKEFTKRS